MQPCRECGVTNDPPTTTPGGGCTPINGPLMAGIIPVVYAQQLAQPHGLLERGDFQSRSGLPPPATP